MTRVFIILQWLLPQHLLSRLIGRLAATEIDWLKNLLIRQFIKTYHVDMQQAQRQQPEQYKNFNDFFTRALVDGARSIDQDPSAVVSPADGQLSELGKIKAKQLLQAKNRYYQTHQLLGSETDAKHFENGYFATVYLSPKDYHRVHIPLAGRLIKTRYIPGKLFSVNQATANNVDNLFSRNERLVCLFETEHGPMAVILVGAMIVAGISTVWQPDLTPGPFTVLETLFDDGPRFAKGDEIGRFYLGSTAIVLLPEASVIWHTELHRGTGVTMGQALGQLRSDNKTAAE